MAITKFSQLDLAKRYSYADYLTWQFKERVELFKGYVIKMSTSPSYEHQSSSSFIFNLIFNKVNKRPCQVFSALFDVRLIDNKKSTADKEIFTVVQPDILVVCDRSKLDSRGVIGAPDLVVEILSPDNSKKEMVSKYELYETNGVLEYWVADPVYKTIQLFHLNNNKYELIKCFYHDEKFESKLFKGLKFKVSDAFNN